MNINKNDTTPVWDIFVRVFHWAIVGLVLLSFVSGEFELGIHPYSGYAIFILVVSRVIWGVVGTQYARFSNFIYTPSTVIQYLKSIIKGSPKRFLGHNPAGGLMVLALLICLATTALSGMKLYGIEEGEGPFAQQTSSLTQIKTTHKEHHEKEEHDDEEFWEEVHEASINLLFLLVLFHIIGVVVASKQHNENLVQAMLSGEKKTINPSPLSQTPGGSTMS